MRLADFILANTEPILAEWEVFARAIWPGAATDPATLRDHAEDMLRATAMDMKSAQTAQQQADKSKGKGGDDDPRHARVNRASAAHGAGRVGSGFDLTAVIAEYRALRASVVRLWRDSGPAPDLHDLDDVTRFNESIDQSLTEAVLAYTQHVERDRRAALELEQQHARELREVNEALLVSNVRQNELMEQAQQAEAASAAIQRDLSDLFDTSSIGLHWVGPDGIILRVNQAELDMLGYGGPGGRDHVVGRHIAEFHVDRPVIDDILARLLRGETLRDQPARLCTKDGSIRNVLINSSALFENGRFVHTRCFTHDVTERTEAEERLREAKREAEEANRAKDKFLAVLSHELRTPLTPVMLTVAAREMDGDLPMPVREDLRMIRRNVELEVRLIDDLLDLSRIASGKLRLTFDVIGINDIVRHVCEMCRGQVREKGIHLHCEIDPAASDVVGDPGRLQQVLWNLVNNAAKFTPEGGHIHITTENVNANTWDERVRVTVRDTGSGIAPELVPRIFDPFEQGDANVTRQHGGLGLGLAISKVLIEQHRGSISVETGGAGRGSTFAVELPALRRADEAEDAPAAGADNGNVAPLRVLVVEDHADTAAVLRRLLSLKGHDVRTAKNAAEALALADAHPFDLILSDLGLPDMTGYDLMARIKERHGLPGIAMSGFGMQEDIERSARAGFADHIVKPLNMTQLEASIRRVAATTEGGGDPRHGTNAAV